MAEFKIDRRSFQEKIEEAFPNQYTNKPKQMEINTKGLKEVSRQELGKYLVVSYEREYSKRNSWCKHDETGAVILHTGANNSGFDQNGDWSDAIYYDIDSLHWQPADMKEVERLMIAEAEKRGYNVGYLKIKLDADLLNIYEDDHEEFYTIWSVKHGWNGRVLKPETPTLEEVKKRYPVRTRLEGRVIKHAFIQSDVFSFHEKGSNANDTSYKYYCDCWTVQMSNQAVVLWSINEGWAEIIEPLFTTNDGKNIYGDSQTSINYDEFYSVHLTTQLIVKFIKGDRHQSTSERVYFSTLELAEQYVRDNRVYEDGEHYRAVLDGVNMCIQYTGEYFYSNVISGHLKESRFDSIGKKITF